MFESLIIILCVFLLALIFYRRKRMLGRGSFVGEEVHEKELSSENPVSGQSLASCPDSASGPSSVSDNTFAEILDEEKLSGLGVSHIKNNAPAEAETIFKKLIFANPENPAHFSNLGMALYHQKKFEEAEAMYRRSLLIDGSRPGRYISLAHVLKELGRLEDAVSEVRRAVALEQENVDYLLLLADLLLSMGMKDDALAVLKEVLKLDPANESVREILGEGWGDLS